MITQYRTTKVDGVRVSWREAGPEDGPVMLLLHGFPASANVFRSVIPSLAGRYRVIAPDYPGHEQSDSPQPGRYDYSFDRFADLIGGLLDELGVVRYAMYALDYGAPVVWRLAMKHPERVTGFVVRKGNPFDNRATD